MRAKHIQKLFFQTPKRFLAGFIFLIVLFIISALISAKIEAWLPSKKSSAEPQHLPITSETATFSLTPEKTTPVGVPVNSTFILQSSASIDTTVLAKSFTITPSITTDLEQKNEHTIIIKPQTNLVSDTVYAFSLLTEEGIDTATPKEEKYSWAYQTQKTFSLLTATPEHTNIDVSPQTPLTLTFSHDQWNVEDLKNALTIEPSTAGDFTKQNTSLIFTPQEGWPETHLITVKINKEAHDTLGKTLGADLVIAFETGYKNTSLKTNVENGLLTFEDYLLYGRPNENISIPFSILPKNIEKSAEKTKLCIIPLSEENFVKELNTLQKFPAWTGYGRFGYTPRTLAENQTCFETPLKTTSTGYAGIIPAPSAGWYTVTSETPHNPTNKQFALLSVSPLSVFTDTLDNAVILWAHDGDDVASNAPVTALEINQTFHLNNEGLAHWKAPEDKHDIILKIEKNAAQQYAVVHWNINTLQASINTDKTTYASGDLMRIWGKISTTQKELTSDLVVRIEKQTSATLTGEAYAIIENKNIKPTPLFSESFATTELKTGNYRVSVLYKNDLIASQNFTLTESPHPILLTATPSRTLALSGDTITITAHAQTINGENINQLPLYDEQNQLLGTTDINGNATITTQVFAEDILTPFINQTVTLKTRDGALGEVKTNTTITVFPANTLAKIDTQEIKDGTAIITLSAHSLNQNWNKKISEEMYGPTMPDEFINASVSYLADTTSTNGTTRKKTDLDSRRLVTDEHGQAKLTFAATENTPYTLTLRTRDEDGRIATIQTYAFDEIRDKTNSIEFSINETNLTENGKTKLKLLRSGQTLAQDKTHALFLKTQNVYQMIQASQKADWSISFKTSDQAGFETKAIWYEQGKYTTLNYPFTEGKKNTRLEIQLAAKNRVQSGNQEKIRLITTRDGTGVPAHFILALTTNPLTETSNPNNIKTFLWKSGKTDEQGIIDLSVDIPDYEGPLVWSAFAAGEQDTNMNITPQGDTTQNIVVTPVFTLRTVGDTTFTTNDTPKLTFHMRSDTAETALVTLRIPELVFTAEKKVEANQVATFELPKLEKGTINYTAEATQAKKTTTTKGAITVQKNITDVFMPERIKKETPGFSVPSNATSLIAIPENYDALYDNAQHLLLPAQTDAEHLFLSREAARAINNIFGDEALARNGATFHLGAYQNEDGGIALIPHGPSNTKLSAYAALFQTSDINTAQLLSFLTKIAHTTTSQGEKIFALAGMRSLGETTLNSLTSTLTPNIPNEETSLLALWLYTDMGAQPEAQRFASQIITTYPDLTLTVNQLLHHDFPSKTLESYPLLYLFFQKTWAAQHIFLPFSTTLWINDQQSQELTFTKNPFLILTIPDHTASVTITEPTISLFFLKPKSPYSGLPTLGKNILEIDYRPISKEENTLFGIRTLGITALTYAQNTPGTCLSFFLPKLPGATFIPQESHLALIANNTIATACANTNPAFTFITGGAGTFDIPNYTLADTTGKLTTPTETNTLIIYEK